MFEKPETEPDVIGRADLDELGRTEASVLVTSRGPAGAGAAQLARRVSESGAVGIDVQQEEVRVRRGHRRRLVAGVRRHGGKLSGGGQRLGIRLAKPEAGQESER
jgi:hypothetical protein